MAKYQVDMDCASCLLLPYWAAYLQNDTFTKSVCDALQQNRVQIDDLHISHNASGMGANIRVLLIRHSSSHSSLDVNGLEFPCLAATMCFTRLRNHW